MLPFVGSAALADAPLGSDGSGTGTVAAPGAAVGIATASLAEKLCGAPAGRVGRDGRRPPPGTLDDEPPPPPQATSSAAPRTTPPSKGAQKSVS